MTPRNLTLTLIAGLAATAMAASASAQIAKGSLADFSDPKTHDPLVNGNGSSQIFNPNDKYTLGYADLKAGRYKEASQKFEDLLVSSPDDAPVLVYAGMALAGLNNLKAARKDFDHALRIQPGNIEARRELGVTLVKLGDAKAAQAELAKLKKSADACQNVCKDSVMINGAVKIVEAALAVGAKAG